VVTEGLGGISGEQTAATVREWKGEREKRESDRADWATNEYW